MAFYDRVVEGTSFEWTICNNGRTEPEEAKDFDLNAQLCTFKKTSHEFHYQHSYNCKTCNLSGLSGLSDKVCIVCKEVCHIGHDLEYNGYSRDYCWCGGIGSRSCKTLTQRSSTPDADIEDKEPTVSSPLLSNQGSVQVAVQIEEEKQENEVSPDLMSDKDVSTAMESEPGKEYIEMEEIGKIQNSGPVQVSVQMEQDEPKNEIALASTSNKEVGKKENSDIVVDIASEANENSVEVENLKEKLRELETKLHSQEIKSQDQNSQIQNQQTQIQSQQSQLDNQQSELQKQNSQLQSKESQLISLEIKSQNQNSQIQSQQTQIQSQQSQLDNQQSKLQTQNSQLQSKESQLQKLQINWKTKKSNRNNKQVY